MKAVKDRFEDKIFYSPCGCWLWTGSTLWNGYGRFNLMGKSRSAHRVSYSLYKGVITKGLYVCHTCDVRSCVNPDHLFLGTHQDNMADCKRKGRTNKLPRTRKLSNIDIKRIRRLFLTGSTQSGIAKMYNVSKPAIHDIVRNKAWKNLL